MDVLQAPEVEALIDAAIAQAKAPFRESGRRLIIRSVSAKQRPRRKGNEVKDWVPPRPKGEGDRG